MPISPLGGAKFEIRPHILKAHYSDFLLVFKRNATLKRNETPICKGFGVIERFSITGSDVMPISPLGAPNFKSESPLATSY